jgi:hypothetical protein
LANTQPLPELQESSVQTLLSSHVNGDPALHAPAAQTSLEVQASPSSQGAMLLENTQPLPELQESSVQTLLSSHVSGDPAVQTPAAQTSLVVQASPSSQAAVLLVFEHRLAMQVSSVHALESLQSALTLQLGGTTHISKPESQTSPPVQLSVPMQTPPVH